MTDITEQDRLAHEWADHQLSLEVNDEGIVIVARAIFRHVPAPPATLADELRTASWGDIPALADRVEAVEKELAGRKRDYIECQEELIASDLALTEARRERDAARNSEAEMQEQFNQMYEKSQKITNQRDDAWAERDAAREEVERLTASLNRQCTTVTPSVHNTDGLTASNDTLPDPADVPPGEPWLVRYKEEQCNGVKAYVGWAIADSYGLRTNIRNDEVTLVSRLVPDVTA